MKDTRKLILQKALELFKEKGYENTSIMDICKACHITKGTFYYHFPNKDELSFLFYEDMFGEFSSVLAELIFIDNVKEQLWRVYEYSIDRTIALGPKVLYSLYMFDIKNGFQLFSPFSRYDLDTHTSQQLKLQIELVKKGQQTGDIKKGDPVIMVRTFVAALTGIAIAWGSNGGSFDEKEELHKAFHVIF